MSRPGAPGNRGDRQLPGSRRSQQRPGSEKKKKGMQACISVCIHACMYACMQTCMYVRTYVRLSVRLSVCPSVRPGGRASVRAHAFFYACVSLGVCTSPSTCPGYARPPFADGSIVEVVPPRFSSVEGLLLRFGTPELESRSGLKEVTPPQLI